MNSRMTRRKMVAAAAGAQAAVASLGAQQPAAPRPIPSTPDEERKAALAQLKSAAAAVAKAPLPIATEPAVHFKA